jgi:hypothetical protein
VAGQGGQATSQSGQGGQAPQPEDWSKLPAAQGQDPELTPLGVREVTYARVCARGRGDSFAQALCRGGQRPAIRDLEQLLELAALGEEQRAFAMTGNSTSLVTKSVSAINPRMIVFPRVDEQLTRPAEMTAVGFVRGEQFVELASRDRVTGDLNFYLVSFEQNCNYATGGCDLASLLTEEVEHGWTAYSVYDQEDLEPTTFDCLSCHRPGGPGSKSILRMQELASPWLHWFPQRFVQRTESDRVLLSQFAEAHKYDKQYGGIPITSITNTLDGGSAAQLEALLRAEGFGEQPNAFDPQIAAEMAKGVTSTWEARFATHVQGGAIAVPYPRIDVTDETKRNAAVRSYQEVVQGISARASLLDIRDVFSEDAAQKLSFIPKPAADGRAVLLQMCARCHDGRSNPLLTKSRFNVLKLSEMSRAQKDLAIARLNERGAGRMPPPRVGNLTPESVSAATAELQR